VAVHAVGRALADRIAGLVLDVGAMSKWWAALIGFSDAGALILGLALPALCASPKTSRARPRALSR
jgi:hypothetical protein